MDDLTDLGFLMTNLLVNTLIFLKVDDSSQSLDRKRSGKSIRLFNDEQSE